MKKMCRIIAAILLTASLFGSLSCFGAQSYHLDEKLLRLHVKAADNSVEAQAQKLAVRDAVLREIGLLCIDAADKAAAAQCFLAHSARIEAAAEACLRDVGAQEQVRVTVERRYFPRKDYADFTLPAGYYDALCIDIGAAAGENWWCLAYPPLCLPAVRSKTDEEMLQRLLSEEEYALICRPTRYRARFFIVELLEKLLGR